MTLPRWRTTVTLFLTTMLVEGKLFYVALKRATFISVHTFKAANAGRHVEKVPARFTSQDCSATGNRAKKSLCKRGIAV
jgi:hypothetical protein